MRIFTATIIIAAITQALHGGTFTEYDNKAAWQDAVRQWATIGFSELPQGTTVTDQYRELGAIFADGDDDIFFTPSFLESWGLRGGSGFEKRRQHHNRICITDVLDRRRLPRCSPNRTL